MGSRWGYSKGHTSRGSDFSSKHRYTEELRARQKTNLLPKNSTHCLCGDGYHFRTQPRSGVLPKQAAKCRRTSVSSWWALPCPSWNGGGGGSLRGYVPYKTGNPLRAQRLEGERKYWGGGGSTHDTTSLSQRPGRQGVPGFHRPRLRFTRYQPAGHHLCAFSTLCG